MLPVFVRCVLQALESLTDIKLAYLEDAQPGFKLIFKFAPNDSFENAELEKTYYYQEEVGYGGDFGKSCRMGKKAGCERGREKRVRS